MDSSKRNVHNSGPLGMLVKSGQVKRVDVGFPEPKAQKAAQITVSERVSSPYFKTPAGIELTEHELLFVDPKECESWKYANRQDDELGEIDELIESIKANKQLQPALIRNHPSPHDGIKYEIIFGRRRHIACLRLGIPFLAIRKDILNLQDAIASQDAENKLRNNVSNFSNAKLYQKLLDDKVFKTEKELSLKLRLSPSSLNDLMAYAKIPNDIIGKIPNVHTLSKSLALKILQLLNQSSDNYTQLLTIAPEIGKRITSPVKLENAVTRTTLEQKKTHVTRQYVSDKGQKLFTYMVDSRGFPQLIVNKAIAAQIDIEQLCEKVFNYLEISLTAGKSGAPD